MSGCSHQQQAAAAATTPAATECIMPFIPPTRVLIIQLQHFPCHRLNALYAPSEVAASASASSSTSAVQAAPIDSNISSLLAALRPIQSFQVQHGVLTAASSSQQWNQCRALLWHKNSTRMASADAFKQDESIPAHVRALVQMSTSMTLTWLAAPALSTAVAAVASTAPSSSASTAASSSTSDSSMNRSQSILFRILGLHADEILSQSQRIQSLQQRRVALGLNLSPAADFPCAWGSMRLDVTSNSPDMLKAVSQRVDALRASDPKCVAHINQCFSLQSPESSASATSTSASSATSISTTVDEIVRQVSARLGFAPSAASAPSAAHALLLHLDARQLIGSAQGGVDSDAQSLQFLDQLLHALASQLPHALPTSSSTSSAASTATSSAAPPLRSSTPASTPVTAAAACSLFLHACPPLMWSLILDAADADGTVTAANPYPDRTIQGRLPITHLMKEIVFKLGLGSKYGS